MLLHSLGFSVRIYRALQSLPLQQFPLSIQGNVYYTYVLVHHTTHSNYKSMAAGPDGRQRRRCAALVHISLRKATKTAISTSCEQRRCRWQSSASCGDADGRRKRISEHPNAALGRAGERLQRFAANNHMYQRTGNLRYVDAYTSPWYTTPKPMESIESNKWAHTLTQ